MERRSEYSPAAVSYTHLDVYKRQQFIIDRRNGNDGANRRPCNGLPDKFGLAHVIVFQPLGKVDVFFLGHAGFDHMAAGGRVVFFLQALTSFLARQGA